MLMQLLLECLLLHRRWDPMLSRNACRLWLLLLLLLLLLEHLLQYCCWDTMWRRHARCLLPLLLSLLLLQSLLSHRCWNAVLDHCSCWLGLLLLWHS